MIDLTNLRDPHLKGFTALHFVLASCAMLGSWCPNGYLFYNCFFFFALFWAIYQRESPEPLEIANGLNALSIILDVVAIAMCFPHSYVFSERFTVAMAILNLVVRSISCMTFEKLRRERSQQSVDYADLPGSNTFGQGSSQSHHPSGTSRGDAATKAPQTYQVV